MVGPESRQRPLGAYGMPKALRAIERKPPPRVRPNRVHCVLQSPSTKILRLYHCIIVETAEHLSLRTLARVQCDECFILYSISV